jgi:hydroxymethylpyrimidine/phosphomethylpyrimidine kinase
MKNVEAVFGNMVRAVEMLEHSRDFAALMPEVRVNLVYALPGARSGRKVAAVDGRITVVNGLPHASGPIKLGGSDHMARLVIEARLRNPDINAGMNFKCDKEIIGIVRKYASSHDIAFGYIDRTREPLEVAAPDRASMPWIVGELVNTYGAVPRLFYEGDGWGKEPLFFCLGHDAVEVVKISLDIARDCCLFLKRPRVPLP